MQNNLMFGRDSGENLPDTFFHSHKAWDAYMAELWQGIFSALAIAHNATVIEVGPGNSVKIALALKKLNFTGGLYLVDPIREILAESEALYRDILRDARIYPIEATLADAVRILPQRPDCIIANHPIDDMIMATTQPKEKLRALFDWTSIAHEQAIPISQESWARLESDTKKLDLLQHSICNEWYSAIEQLKPRYCVISQYASATLKNNGMDGLNRQGKAILEKMRTHYSDSVMPEMVIQTALNANTHYNDAHIGNEVLNAGNWLVIKPAHPRLFRHSGNLYQNPELFDFVVNSPENEMDFYLNQAKRLGKDILELACGTGRVSLHMMAANNTLRCEGLDLSEAMLAHARAKAKAAGINATFYQGDMSHFSLGKKYDLIFVPLSSLLYLQTNEQLKGCFDSVRAHLKPQGEFIFAAFNPSAKILSLTLHERYEIKRFIDPENGKEILVEQSSNYDREKRVNFAMHYYSYTDQKDFFSHPVHLRILYPADVQQLLKICRFKMLACYGDYRGAAFSEDSRFQLVVCQPE